MKEIRGDEKETRTEKTKKTKRRKDEKTKRTKKSEQTKRQTKYDEYSYSIHHSIAYSTTQYHTRSHTLD